MDSCIFCKLVSGEIPSFKINENNDFLAFLDINPNTKGASVISTKKHFSSDITDLEPQILSEIMDFAQETCVKIKDKLEVRRVGIAIEGMGVNHFHIKLYPFHGLGENLEHLDTTHEKMFFEKYPGYLTTQIGEQADFDELKKISEMFN